MNFDSSNYEIKHNLFKTYFNEIIFIIHLINFKRKLNLLSQGNKINLLFIPKVEIKKASLIKERTWKKMRPILIKGGGSYVYFSCFYINVSMFLMMLLCNEKAIKTKCCLFIAYITLQIIRWNMNEILECLFRMERRHQRQNGQQMHFA